ncbi:hypothetical protein OEZ86_006483 [Tetradesmus obliquus]|nr:hypothetical protein OEZ86_006483 [Tetradesmus obliquus]
MMSRKVLCLALVALAFCSSAHAFAAVAEGDASELSSTGHVIMTMANPSAPPTATAAEPKVLLSLPRLSLDLGITGKKVPLLSVADAPCKKLCKNKCEINMEKTCLNVTLPKKDCKLGSKTITKKFCEKRCKPSLDLSLPALHLPKLPTTLPANANPSTPPAAVQAAAASQDAQGLAGSAISALQGLVADKLPKLDVDVACRDVCIEVPIVLPELECSESSKVVEKCTVVPEKSCKEECVCLPKKSLTLSLPKKPALSVSASVDSKVDG